jgi:hypothetical protein
MPPVQALVCNETGAVTMDGWTDENGREWPCERGEQRGRNETTSTPHNLLEPWGHYQTRLRSMQGGVVLGRSRVGGCQRKACACGEMAGSNFQCFDQVR